MRIYLDFDGTLHRMPAVNGPFEHLEAFEAILRDYPAAHVVISSSWRERFPFEEMREWFSPDVWPQIVGVTPVLPGSVRQQEIEVHLKQTDYRGEFVILDDDESEFPGQPLQLIRCDIRFGLQVEQLQELRHRLEHRPLA